MATAQMTKPSGSVDFSLPITINAAGSKLYELQTINKFLDGNIDITITTPAGTANHTLTSLPSGQTITNTIGRGNYLKIGAGYYDNDLYYQAEANTGTLTLTTSHSAQTNISCDGYANVKVEGLTVPVDKTFSLVITADSAVDNTSNVSITNGAYRQLNITNVVNGNTSITNRGNTTVTSDNSSSGNLSVVAYPPSGSTIENSQTIVSNGRWVCTPTFNGAGTYYGKVVVGAVNASLGGSTTTSGKASAAITAVAYTATGTTNLSCQTTAPASGTAGQDYWQVKATASITTTAKFTPSLTLTTAGWMASAPTGSATNVTVNGDSTGKSIYIPKAIFSVDGNVVYCSSAGYIPAGSASDGIGTIATGTITPNASLPSGTNAESTIINRGGYIKIGSGYYSSDIYYQAQANTGTLTLNSTNHSAQTNISCDGYANVKVTGLKVPSGAAFSLTMVQATSDDNTGILSLANNSFRKVNVTNNKGSIDIAHTTSGQGNVSISANNESSKHSIITNGAWVTTDANIAGAGTYYGKVTLTAGTISAQASEPSSSVYTNRPNVALAAGGWLQLTAGYYPATAISLATLIGDDTNILPAASGFSSVLRTGYTAYDDQGNLLQGSLETYQGYYEVT